PAMADTTTTRTSAPSSTSGASDAMRSASATLLPPNLWTRVTPPGRSAATADVAAEATASPRSWGADDMLWKLRLGSASGRGGSRAAPRRGRARRGGGERCWTRGRTGAPMGRGGVVIVGIEAGACAGNAPGRVAKRAWMLGMGGQQYRAMVQMVKAQFDCSR